MVAMTPNIPKDAPQEPQQVAAQNVAAIRRFDGRLRVLCKFIDAVLPRLSSTQCDEIAARFRLGVGDVMSLTDGVAPLAEYHEALLKQTAVLLTALEVHRVTQQ